MPLTANQFSRRSLVEASLRHDLGLNVQDDTTRAGSAFRGALTAPAIYNDIARLTGRHSEQLISIDERGGLDMKAAVREKERGAESPTLEEQVRQRAYELYVMRGDEAGSELDDWLQAEQEILQAQEQGR